MWCMSSFRTELKLILDNLNICGLSARPIIGFWLWLTQSTLLVCKEKNYWFNPSNQKCLLSKGLWQWAGVLDEWEKSDWGQTEFLQLTKDFVNVQPGCCLHNEQPGHLLNRILFQRFNLHDKLHGFHLNVSPLHTRLQNRVRIQARQHKILAKG